MGRYQGVSDAAVDAALERVELAGRGADAFRSYSLGMKQRLGVASALLGDPELLVLDEPTNGLDPAGMADMRRLIVELAQQGQTVLLSSHLLGEVQENCDRVGVIAHGRLIAESTVAELRGASTVHVRAEPVDRTLAVAMQVAGDDAVRLQDGGVQLDLAAISVPELARALVTSGVDIHEIRPSERSLEDVFFEMTAASRLGSGEEEQR
jgi:ABC-2 type transport system ATP-binding protein